MHETGPATGPVDDVRVGDEEIERPSGWLRRDSRGAQGGNGHQGEMRVCFTGALGL